jgi:PadR family transcriptional regulator PadR
MHKRNFRSIQTVLSTRGKAGPCTEARLLPYRNIEWVFVLDSKFGLTSFFRSGTFFKNGTCVITSAQQLAIRKGLLEFAVLKVVGVGSVYAADILRRMQETEFATQEGTLYPLLSKLRREGLVAYEWQESELGPPRKYYQLTDLGRDQLVALDQYWKTIDQTLQQLGRRSAAVTES